MAWYRVTLRPGANQLTKEQFVHWIGPLIDFVKSKGDRWAYSWEKDDSEEERHFHICFPSWDKKGKSVHDIYIRETILNVSDMVRMGCGEYFPSAKGGNGIYNFTHKSSGTDEQFIGYNFKDSFNGECSGWDMKDLKAAYLEGLEEAKMGFSTLMQNLEKELNEQHEFLLEDFINDKIDIKKYNLKTKRLINKLIFKKAIEFGNKVGYGPWKHLRELFMNNYIEIE